jgi:protein transport protein SEC61 subunit gamma-like protein|tara:strand:+ start:2067 stop:2306 length:240 start_codon:yes stop_codon:yes gene_type:complete
MASPIQIDAPEIHIPKPKEWPGLMRKKLREYRRVLSITKKPSMEEFKAVVKVTGLGMAVIGLIGFTIFMVVQGIGSLGI